MRRRLRAGFAAVAVLIVLAVLVWHHAVARFAVASIIGLTTGYRVDIGEMRLGRNHGAFLGTHISRKGEPVLDATRIDLYYSLRDLLPGSKHRFGLLGVTIDQPQLTIVHHQDRTYNITSPGGGAPATPGRPNEVPLNFTVRVRGGQAQLIDDYTYYKEARLQGLQNINADVSINTATRTKYLVTGAITDRRPQPFKAAGTIDYPRGYATHRLEASAIPISAIGNYFINSPAAHILGGMARNLDAKIYALDIKPDVPFAYHILARAQLSGAQIYVRGLQDPLDNLRGTINVFDGGFTAKRLDASVNGIPLQVAGGIFNFAKPQFRLGVKGAGDLNQLRHEMAFAAKQKLHGIVHLNVLIEGAISQPLLIIGFDSQRLYYNAIPIDQPRGVVAYYNGDLCIVPFRAYYGGLQVRIHGLLHLAKQPQSQFVLHFTGPSSRVPYLAGLLEDQPLAGEALLSGTGLALGARGYLASEENVENINAFYEIGADGVSMVGPLSIAPAGGGVLYAAYSLDRPHNTSAFWLTAHDLHLHHLQANALPGLSLPPMPAIDGTVLDASLAGTGASKDLVIGGRVFAQDASIAGVRMTMVNAAFSGPFSNVAMERVHVEAPWGNFDGRGSFGPARLVARGVYSGRLNDLRQFTGDIGARGAAHGPVSFALANNHIIVQAQGVQLHGASVHQVPVQTASGTIDIANGVMRVYNARAQIAGGSIVAAGSYATSPNAQTRNDAIALATTQLNGAQLRGLGLPLQGGGVHAIGTLRAGGKIPAFNGGVVVSNGRAQGFAIGGSAEVNLANDAVQLRNGVAALGETYGIVDGRIESLTSGSPAYEIHAQVPVGDIAAVGDTLNLPTHMTQGSFSADLQIRGRGTDPSVNGPVQVPVGSTNGLGFLDANADLTASRSGVSARDGSVQVGTTHANFSASASNALTAVYVRARHADLTDFNDYFDTGDTLSGAGYVDFSLASRSQGIATTGDFDVDGLRYRNLPIGNTDAHWSSRNDIVHGNLSVGGEHGLLKAHGSVAFAPSHTIQETIARSRYDLNGTLANLDLSTWLPALGFPQVPMTGHVNGTAHVIGRYPHLGIGGDATMQDGNIGPFPIENARVSAQAINGDRIAVTSLALRLPALEATGSGTFGLAPNDPLALSVQAQTGDLRRIIAELTKKFVPITGSFTTMVEIGGTMHTPTFAAGLEAIDADVYGLKIPSAVGSLALSGRNLLVRNAEVTLGKGRATLAGALPLELSPFAIGPRSAAVSLDFSARGVNLALLAPLLGHKTQLSGTVDGHIGLSGTVGDPRIFGQLALANGSYRSDLETVPITNTVAQLTFSGESAMLDRLHAQLGRGVLDAAGRIAFRGGLEHGAVAYNLNVTTHRAELDFPAYGSGTLDASLQLVHAPGSLARLSGVAALDNAIIPFSTFYRPDASNGAGSAAQPKLPFNLAFDLTVKAGRNVRVRAGGIGAGFDISGTGVAKLTGTLANPTLDGRFDSSGGTLTYFDHTFKVQSGFVTFDPVNGLVPYVRAVATTHVVNPDPNVTRNPTGGVDITVKIDAPLDQLASGTSGLDLSSNPSGYTRDQLIALLLPFGGFVTSVRFTDNGQLLPPGQLKGAPPAVTGALLPQDLGVFRQAGNLTVSQEAFNVFNAQIASGVLGPFERVLSDRLGLSDVSFFVDYNGNVGVNLLRDIGKNISAFYGTTFRSPLRESLGATYSPGPFTTASLSFYVQQGELTPSLAKAGQALQSTSGFTFTYQRLFP
ncbi:MAG: translocation/assembly module TamB domain-containing protein [Vulcanimicrobiaceae bacterium]